ncbi:hypothetical protein DXV75_16730 [Alteromonas aestuariivivens]|uniref:Uncharacterized protein n=1 Tax=Alteromonas aestuariivivens TaxID=1938339 RepID=A0A3D8M2I8_9ALTE|nr:hypothetical protein [Alteromonas aestuariivivens]RDV23913.1 hypothetical protein DXV75_16730 [Alteromonas aestuariivivens]
MSNIYFSQYSAALKSYTDDVPFCESLKMHEEKDFSVYFSPFEFVNKDAKIVVVGISPGATQADIANVCARDHLSNGNTEDQVSELAKKAASFGGALRSNLVSLLDHVGISHYLGISSCASLFTTNSKLLHSTSVFRYPTLHKGVPISSAKPGLTNSFLKHMIDTYLKSECEQFGSEVLYLPLGQGVADILLYLADEGVIGRQQVLIGLPHPSGANAERIQYFLGQKEKAMLSAKTNANRIDETKRALMAQLRTLGKSPSTEPFTVAANMVRKETTAKLSTSAAKAASSSLSNFASPSDGFMQSGFEQRLRESLQAAGLKVAPIKGRKSKELAILSGDVTIAYVSRKSGLKKGELVIVVHPRFAQKLDKATADIYGVKVRMGCKSRFVSSSNYHGFNSKDWTDQILTNEHIAAAYTVDVNDGLSPLMTLLKSRLAA